MNLNLVETTFLKQLIGGGPVMFIIAFLSIIAVYIFIAKWFQFHRAQVNVGELIMGLTNVLRRDGFTEAITLCDNTPGPAARILYSAIQAYQGKDDIKLAIESQAQQEVPRMEAQLNVLATIAYVAPLLGLLGTVIGMFEAFQALESGAGMTLPELSKGIYKALVCTAGGLCVAIPCHIAYNYLLTRVQHFCAEMEKAAAEILYFFQQHSRNGGENGAE